MYSGYVSAYQRPASPVMLSGRRADGYRSGSPVMVMDYGYQPVHARQPVTQQRYPKSSNIQMIPIQNAYGSQMPEHNRLYASPVNGFHQTSSRPMNKEQHPVAAWKPVRQENRNERRANDNNNCDGLDDVYDDFELIDFEESLSRYPLHERVAYAMIWAKEGKDAAGGSDGSAKILMLVSESGLLGFPGGHFEHSDRSVVDGLNRELREELNLKSKFYLKQTDHLFTSVRQTCPFVEYFYCRQVPASDLVNIQKRVPTASNWGKEIFGVISVPLSVENDNLGGLPIFLANKFLRNARSLLIRGIQMCHLMPEKQLREAILTSDKYLREREAK